MAAYLLDTNTVSYLADRASPFHERTKRRLLALSDADEVAISILTLYELTYGLLFDPAQARLLTIIQEESVRIVLLTEPGAALFAALKHRYRRHTGTNEKALSRHNLDLILASTAIAGGAVLVSNDGIFAALARLEPRLAVENWAA